jgi:hypothetical protein
MREIAYMKSPTLPHGASPKSYKRRSWGFAGGCWPRREPPGHAHQHNLAFIWKGQCRDADAIKLMEKFAIPIRRLPVQRWLDGMGRIRTLMAVSDYERCTVLNSLRRNEMKVLKAIRDYQKSDTCGMRGVRNPHLRTFVD